MKIEDIKKILKDGEEIEFKYDNKEFSITFFEEKGKTKLSFCEFYKNPIDADTIDEILEIDYNGKTVKYMLEQIEKKDIIIY